MVTPTSDTQQLIRKVFDALPSERIGEVYCDEGARDFFETMRPRIVEDGFEWADQLAKRLRRIGGPPCSLYVGAGLAELPALLCEALDLDRKPVATNLREDECKLLNDALRKCGVAPNRLAFVARSAQEGAGQREFSHVSIVSVLTDPETFPTVSGLEYGRLPVVMLDVAEFERERAAIRELLDVALRRLSAGGLVTTTAEETPWILDWAGRREPPRIVTPDDVSIDTAVVGDPIGFLHVA